MIKKAIIASLVIGALGGVAYADSLYVTSTAVGVNDSTPSTDLDVTGEINATTAVNVGYGSTDSTKLTNNALQFNKTGASNSWISQTGGSSIGLQICYASPCSSNMFTSFRVKPDKSAQFYDNLAISGVLYGGSSDEQLKENLVPIEGALGKVLTISGVSYTRKSTGKKEVGVVAQNVEAVFPELVATIYNEDTGTEIKHVAYGNLVAPLIEAIREQQVMIEQLQERVAKLEGR